MFIRTLRIFSEKSSSYLRTVDFHPGANFIVDDDDSSRRNKVGKTTFLRLIDLAMGANDPSLIYKDKETNSINRELQNLIIEKQIRVEIHLASDFHIDESDPDYVKLSVALYPKGSRYFDGERVSANVYRRNLKELLFNSSNEKPTFRSLIPAFVRVSIAGDNNKFLKFLHQTTSNAEYRAVYSFLFKLADTKLSVELAELTSSLRALQDARSRFERITNEGSLESLKQILVALNSEKSEIMQLIDDKVDAEDFQQNRHRVFNLRSEYTLRLEKISNIEYKILKLQRSIGATKQDLEARNVDRSILRSFYDEVSQSINEVQKSFEDLLIFNEKLYANKIEFLESSISSFRARLDKETQQLRDFEASNEQFFSLLTNDNLEAYVENISSLGQVEKRIGEVENSISTIQKFDDEQYALNSRVSSLEADISADGNNPEDQLAKFNSIFTKMARSINGESPIVVYSSKLKSFPLEFKDISGSSTGTKKSLLAAYDLSYQLFARANNISCPQFVVHDVVENIEGKDLSKIVEIADSSKIQYIVAILKEKLVSSNIPQDIREENTIASLSLKHRVFE